MSFVFNERRNLKTMETIKTLFDNFGNMAIIEKGMAIPYRDAKRKEVAYRLSLYSMYDSYFLYHVSVHDTIERLKNKLNEYSGGDWHEDLTKEN